MSIFNAASQENFRLILIFNAQVHAFDDRKPQNVVISRRYLLI